MKNLISALIILFTIPSYAQNVAFDWVGQFSGPNDDRSRSVAVDDSSNVYTIGDFSGTVDFDPGPGAFNLTANGNRDIFISKLDSSGNFVWAARLGGASDDYGMSIALDSPGNVYATGTFTGTADFDPGTGVYNFTSVGAEDIFISKLSTAGNFVWAKAIEGALYDYGNSIALDASGNIYIGGTFYSTTDFDPGPGTFYLNSTGGADVFILKLNAVGNFLWAKSAGGPNYDWCYSIAVDTQGNIHSTGTFQSTVDFDPGPAVYNLTALGFEDVFVIKLDPSGNFAWAKRLGGNYNEYGYGITVDALGYVYTTGSFLDTTDFDPGPGTFILTGSGGDVFVSKLNPAGNFVWAKKMGGAQTEIGYSVAVDSSQNVYTAGEFGGIADFDPGPGVYTLTPALIGVRDAFISKLDSSGDFLWAKRLGGLSNDWATALKIDDSRSVYTTGQFQGICDFQPDTATYNLTSAGSYDMYVHKMKVCDSYFSMTDTACNSYTSPSGNYTWSASGTYMDTIPNNSGCDSVITINLTIDPDTSVSATSTTLSSNAIGAIYQWVDCNNNYAPVSGQINQLFTPSSSGNYAVIVTQNNCTDTSSCHSISLADVYENHFSLLGQLFPNPSDANFTIILNGQFDFVRISITNSMGQLVLEKTYQHANQIQECIHAPSGLYFIELVAGGNVVRTRLVML
ncbi:MAG: SBBP repeat-containing protein [Bacteroidota bacterium]